MAPTPGPTPEAVRKENQKIRRLRLIVDLVSTLLRQTDMPLSEAVRLVRIVRAQALVLFPGKERTYDLIYGPRFARILRDKYRIDYPEF